MATPIASLFINPNNVITFSDAADLIASFECLNNSVKISVFTTMAAINAKAAILMAKGEVDKLQTVLG